MSHENIPLEQMGREGRLILTHAELMSEYCYVYKGIRGRKKISEIDSLNLQKQWILSPCMVLECTLGYYLVILGHISIWYPSRAVRTNLPSSWHRSITFLGNASWIWLEISLKDPQTPTDILFLKKLSLAELIQPFLSP